MHRKLHFPVERYGRFAAPSRKRPERTFKNLKVG